MKFRYGNLRAWVRLGVAFFIALSVLLNLPVAGVCYLKIGYLQLVCPVGFTELCLAARRFYWDLFPAFLVVLLLVLLSGRLFCSWFCPASFLGEQTVKACRRFLPKRFVEAFGSRWHTLASRAPHLEFGDAMALLSGAVVGIFIFGYPFLSAICPVGVVTRSIISLFAHLELRYDLILLLLPLGVGLLFSRGWKSCCPVGNVRGLVAKANRTLVPFVDETACKSCGVCGAVCPLGIGPSPGGVDTKLCVKCFECLDACPKKAIRIGFRRVHGR